MLEHLCLVRLGDVAMPVPHRDVGFRTEVLEAQELVVYQRLERSNVHAAHRGRRVLPELRQYGEEGGLGLARGGRSGEQDVLVGVEDGVCGSNLHGAQALPVVLVDEVLDERGVAVECVHGGLDVELGELVFARRSLSNRQGVRRSGGRVLLRRSLYRRGELTAPQELLNRDAGVL